MSKFVTISQDQKLATVIVHLFFEPDLQDKIYEITQTNLAIFEKQKGFISAAVHRDIEQHTQVTYLQWETVQDHYNCMESPDFEGTRDEFFSLVEDGKISMEVKVYEVAEIR